MRAPGTLLLGRYDRGRRLRLVARTAPLSTAARRDVGAVLRPAGPEHPWRDVRFSAGWGRGDLDFTPVDPELVVEFVADTSVDEGPLAAPREGSPGQDRCGGWSGAAVRGVTTTHVVARAQFARPDNNW
ncbi:hypothetical protein [Streptomyces musisoli]|uniref:hypothetical protein n=1 Tax=Streptomyces musisoli TaxID=2802280 RepID=UPI001F3EAA36|nr:hypothetical protein [Streptomyces musisoli]